MPELFDRHLLNVLVPLFKITFQSEADVGIVESILLKNFMCHSVLDFKFNSNVNFVIGRNGSRFIT